jgi:hypothetical protein
VTPFDPLSSGREHADLASQFRQDDANDEHNTEFAAICSGRLWPVIFVTLPRFPGGLGI